MSSCISNMRDGLYDLGVNMRSAVKQGSGKVMAKVIGVVSLIARVAFFPFLKICSVSSSLYRSFYAKSENVIIIDLSIIEKIAKEQEARDVASTIVSDLIDRAVLQERVRHKGVVTSQPTETFDRKVGVVNVAQSVDETFFMKFFGLV